MKTLLGFAAMILGAPALAQTSPPPIDAAAVTAAPIGGNRSPVGHARQRRYGGAHQLVADLATQVGDQAKAAIILDRFRIIQTHWVLADAEKDSLFITPSH